MIAAVKSYLVRRCFSVRPLEQIRNVQTLLQGNLRVSEKHATAGEYWVWDPQGSDNAQQQSCSQLMEHLGWGDVTVPPARRPHLHALPSHTSAHAKKLHFGVIQAQGRSGGKCIGFSTLLHHVTASAHHSRTHTPAGPSLYLCPTGLTDALHSLSTVLH